MTNLIGPMLPTIIHDFHISYTLAGLVPFSFFLAYGVISVPAGLLLERQGPKATLQMAFAINVAGAALIGFQTTYASTILGLFLIGLGMAGLQVVLNPLMRTVVGEQDFAFYSVLGQLVFGAASFLSPFTIQPIYALSRAMALSPFRWATFYVLFAGALLAYLLLTNLVSFPRAAPSAERQGSLAVHVELLRNSVTWRYFLAIVAYVGVEQSIAYWLSQFLQVYHGVSAVSVGAETVALFWGAMAIGCCCGMVLLRLLDAQRLLTGATCLAACTLLLALTGDKQTALIAFPLCGLMLSVMFSIIFSLALGSMRTNHGALSGILCSGILGGALVPFAVGWLADLAGLRAAMFLVLCPIAYLTYISLSARPLIKNRTVTARALLPLRG